MFLARLRATHALPAGFENLDLISINSKEHSVGRSLENSTVIPYVEISRKHCVLKAVSNGWALNDQSSYGIIVNDTKLTKGVDFPIETGDVIKFDGKGVFSFIFENNLNERSNNTITNNDVCQDNTNKIVKNKRKNQNLDEIKKKVSLLEVTILEKNQNINELKNNFEEINTDLQCSVCNELFINSVILQCGHTFCSYCISTWSKINNICPTCRRVIKSKCSNRNIDTIVDNIVSKMNIEEKNYRNTILINRQTAVRNARKRLSDENNASTSTNLSRYNLRRRR